MAGRNEIGFEHKGIGLVLAHNRLRVPLNQREYSWEEEHVEELFSDFSTAIDKSDRPTYFLGTIVLTRGNDDVPEVSDGQQRLATTTILLAAIRDYLKSVKDFPRATAIEQEFLKTTDFETTDTVPKLQLNVDDNEFFKAYVVDGEHHVLAKRESHKRIKRASQLAAEHMATILEPYTKESSKTVRLQQWVKFLREVAEVIVLRVPDIINAFVMFETLNDRGLKASQADLIKNYLLSFCRDMIPQGQQSWAQMTAVLESLGQGDISVTYLHHLLIIKNGPTREREVFDRVRSAVTSQPRALEFLDELATSANDYAALFNSDHRKWNEYGTKTRKHLSTINQDLRVEQIRPLLFAVAKYFSVNEAKAAFKLFVAWSVRFLIVGGRGGLLERNYALRAVDVASRKIKSAAELATAMEEVVPSDALFESAFSEARLSHTYFARYVLRALELKAKGEAEPELVPSNEENAVNVEHVLPENPDGAWDIEPKTAEANYKRIGNMVLLQAKKNHVLGNSPFTVKRPVLKTSAFALTAEVATPAKWGLKEIETRQKRLAKLAVQTWPITL